MRQAVESMASDSATGRDDSTLMGDDQSSVPELSRQNADYGKRVEEPSELEKSIKIAEQIR